MIDKFLFNSYNFYFYTKTLYNVRMIVKLIWKKQVTSWNKQKYTISYQCILKAGEFHMQYT